MGKTGHREGGGGGRERGLSSAMAAQAPEACPQGPAQDVPNLPQPQPSFTPPEVFFPSPKWPHGFTPCNC